MSPPPHAVARMADGGRSKIQEVQIILILPLKLRRSRIRRCTYDTDRPYAHYHQLPRRRGRLRDAA